MEAGIRSIMHAERTFLLNTCFEKIAWASRSLTSIKTEENLRTTFCSIALEKQREELKLSGKLEERKLAQVTIFRSSPGCLWRR